MLAFRSSNNNIHRDQPSPAAITMHPFAGSQSFEAGCYREGDDDGDDDDDDDEEDEDETTTILILMEAAVVETMKMLPKLTITKLLLRMDCGCSKTKN